VPTSRDTPSGSPLADAWFLTGQTASGKSAIALALARRLPVEILALDSMTLYRGMDIGTAKPSPADRAAVPHHLIDLLDPWQAASVGQYRAWALAAVAEIRARGKIPLFVGGTPLYLKALLRGLFEGPPADAALRAALEAEAQVGGNAALHARLAAIDPPTAARLHPNDRRRIIRALEVHTLTGRRLSDLQREHDQPATGARVLALVRHRTDLAARIDRRVDAMFAAGLIDEVRQLQASPRPIHRVPAQAVGYAEVIDHLAGRLTLPQALERTRLRTRQFARRQSTWFRGLAEVQLWPLEPDTSTEATADALAHWFSCDVPGRRPPSFPVP
jgi:tRNA dimethylallyltransferase